MQAQCMCAGKFGAFLGCEAGIAKQVHAFTLFGVCTHVPYVRRCNKGSHDNLKKVTEKFLGYSDHFSKIMDGQPATFSGPFTIGMCWEKIPTRLTRLAQVCLADKQLQARRRLRENAQFP